MKLITSRRRFLVQAAALIATPWLYGNRAAAAGGSLFAELETNLGGRIGLFALDTGSGARVTSRSAERFAMCSTFKLVLVGAVLQRSAQSEELLGQRISFQESELVTHSPVTANHLGDGMTVAELCAATLQYSDNTAANLLIGLVGGPAAVTDFARSIGDQEFRLDRLETALNSAIPGDPRDTTTPEAMGLTLQRLTVGEALGQPQRDQLCDWLRGNTTGDSRIRAGVADGWVVGDKTGSGSYGVANDIAVIWPPERAPIILTIYTSQQDPTAPPRSDIVAAATRIALAALG